MKPYTASFPCSIGDIVNDRLTGRNGVIAGLCVDSDGTTRAEITYLNHEGNPQSHWVSTTRVESND